MALCMCVVVCPVRERAISLVRDLLERHDLLLAHGRNDCDDKILAVVERLLHLLANLVIGCFQVLL